MLLFGQYSLAALPLVWFFIFINTKQTQPFVYLLLIERAFTVFAHLVHFGLS
jgi:hypothetical protein